MHIHRKSHTKMRSFEPILPDQTILTKPKETLSLLSASPLITLDLRNSTAGRNHQPQTIWLFGSIITPSQEMFQHDRKRQIELKLVVLDDKLVDHGYTEADIMERLSDARRDLESAAAAAVGAEAERTKPLLIRMQFPQSKGPNANRLCDYRRALA